MGNKITVRDFGALGLGLAFIYIGIDHFINPIWYEPIVPSLLPDATFWVLISPMGSDSSVKLRHMRYSPGKLNRNART